MSLKSSSVSAVYCGRPVSFCGTTPCQTVSSCTVQHIGARTCSTTNTFKTPMMTWKTFEKRVATKTLHAKGDWVISPNRNLQDFYMHTAHIFYLWHMPSICLSFLKRHLNYPANSLPIRKQTCTWRKDVKAWSGGSGSGSNYRFSFQRLVSPHARKVCAVVLCVVWILCAILGIPKSELLFIFTDQIPS